MAKTEDRIKLAAKIYRCRDVAKKFYGEKYFDKIEDYKGYINTYMARHGVDELQAVIGLGNDLKDQDAGVAIMLLTAAACEILEPSK